MLLLLSAGEKLETGGDKLGRSLLASATEETVASGTLRMPAYKFAKCCGGQKTWSLATPRPKTAVQWHAPVWSVMQPIVQASAACDAVSPKVSNEQVGSAQ